MAIERKNEILAKAAASDAQPIPRYNLVDASGNVVAENVALELQNNIVQQGTPVDKQTLDECLAASGTADGTKKALTLAQSGYVLFDGAVVEFKLFDTLSGSATLNVNSTGAKRIKMPNGEDPDGFIAGDWITAIYSATLDAYVISGGGSGGGSIDMNINLLKEVEKMKYCKVLDRKGATTEDQLFFADALRAAVYKAPGSPLTIYAKLPCAADGQASGRDYLLFYFKLANGTTVERTVQFDGALTYGGQSSYAGKSTAASVTGHFCFIPVSNKSDRVAFYADCTAAVTYYTSSSGSTNYRHWVCFVVFDTTTGNIVSSWIPGILSSNVPSNMLSMDQQSLWCYYNSTYSKYYWIGPYRYDNVATYLCYIGEGIFSTISNLPSTGDVGYVGSISAFGAASDDYSYFRWGCFVSDTQFLRVQFCTSYTQNILYKYTFSAYNSVTNSSISMGSSYAYPSSPGGDITRRWYALYANGSLYLVHSNAVHVSPARTIPGKTTTTSSLYGVGVFGPYRWNTTTLNTDIYTLLKYTTTNNIHCQLPADGNINKVRYAEGPSDSSGTIQVYVCVDEQVPAIKLPLRTQSYSWTSGIADGVYGFTRPGTTGYIQDEQTVLIIAPGIFYLGPVQSYAVAPTSYWECPEDGVYKIILVGGGANGSTSNGGGSGYLKICTKACIAGERIPYRVGAGLPVNMSNLIAPEAFVTQFGDEIAFSGNSVYGGANGWPSADGGGGGGYNLVDYGGNGQASSLVPNLNGGQGSMPAIGYGAGGSANQDGQDGCIVIIR